MKIATWNVNSVRKRRDRLNGWIAEHNPDVLCLQEIKVETTSFPDQDLKAAGYQVALIGQKTYNGVAIASRHPLEDVTIGFGDGGDDSEARFIVARTGGVRVASIYVPNGQAVDHPRYHFKLAWLGRLRGWLDRHARPDEPLLLCGDFNVTPTDLDVYDPVAWAGQILCSEPERAALRQLMAWGLDDLFRTKHAEGGLYSFWDYRGVAFFRNYGLRIDHILTTASVTARCQTCVIDRNARKGQDPSDHAPVVAVLDAG